LEPFDSTLFAKNTIYHLSSSGLLVKQDRPTQGSYSCARAARERSGAIQIPRRRVLVHPEDSPHRRTDDVTARCGSSCKTSPLVCVSAFAPNARVWLLSEPNICVTQGCSSGCFAADFVALEKPVHRKSLANHMPRAEDFHGAPSLDRLRTEILPNTSRLVPTSIANTEKRISP
jgi:hypothetical protein